jgi:hypothetical protein
MSIEKKMSQFLGKENNSKCIGTESNHITTKELIYNGSIVYYKNPNC